MITWIINSDVPGVIRVMRFGDAQKVKLGLEQPVEQMAVIDIDKGRTHEIELDSDAWLILEQAL